MSLTLLVVNFFSSYLKRFIEMFYCYFRCFAMAKCLVCCQSGENLVVVTDRGIKSLKEFAVLRSDERVIEELEKAEEIYVHEKCRKWFNNRKRIASDTKCLNEDSKSLKVETRNSSSPFDWANDCFICGKDLDTNHKKCHSVLTLEIKSTLLADCDDQLSFQEDDALATAVRGRLMGCIDLVAKGAQYHQNCRVNFSLKRNLENKKSIGNPRNSELNLAFEETCNWLESQVELHTLKDFMNKMKEKSVTHESYSRNHTKTCLKEKYGQYITITSQGEGKPSIIGFQNTINYLIEQKYRQKEENNGESEKERMVNILGNVIKDEIRSINMSEYYPNSEELSDIDFLENWLPKSLVSLLSVLVPSKLKRTAIGHSITSACRRNLMSPLLLGLGVELDHSFGSKWLNNHLSRLGFSVTNQQVRQFKEAALEQNDPMDDVPSNSFVQWSADNVDHNIGTLDGKNTFHGMGMIAAVTPNLLAPGKIVRKVQATTDTKKIASQKAVPIKQYFGSCVPPSTLKLKQYSLLKVSASIEHDEERLKDLIWISSWLLKNKPTFEHT